LIRSVNANLAVVVMSCLPDWNEYVEVLTAGAFDLIASHCQSAELIWVTRRVHQENSPEACLDYAKPRQWHAVG
jgi:FixJ family two-component response regulator